MKRHNPKFDLLLFGALPLQLFLRTKMGVRYIRSKELTVWMIFSYLYGFSHMDTLTGKFWCFAFFMAVCHHLGICFFRENLFEFHGYYVGNGWDVWNLFTNNDFIVKAVIEPLFCMILGSILIDIPGWAGIGLILFYCSIPLFLQPIFILRFIRHHAYEQMDAKENGIEFDEHIKNGGKIILAQYKNEPASEHIVVREVVAPAKYADQIFQNNYR